MIFCQSDDVTLLQLYIVTGNWYLVVVEQLDYSLLHRPGEQRRRRRRSFKQNDKLSRGFTQLVSWGGDKRETRERQDIQYD